MPTRTLTKMSKLCFRFSENQKMKVRRPLKNHRKIDEETSSQTCWQKVSKICPKWFNLGSNKGPKRWLYFSGFVPWGLIFLAFVFLLFFVAFLGHLGTILGATWGHFGTILGPFWNHFVPYLDQCLLQLLCLVCLHFFDFFNCFYPRPGDCAQRFKIKSTPP